ncbi:uncharacterized protein LOC133888447 isoform X2 [Phragmites australis]|uniref:uncharacterized protein LOC133888447 isoform X2 n=1 Tax=Phragmites australis TaxID=29695 RepID=UPI002D79FA54|nr:uncharacterized protein LOC133888447 isoform X2 [Phragmites australis]
MTGVVSWYGPLIDLSAAASHVGGFVQLLASVRRVLPHQEQNATTGRTYHKTIIEVGDDTRSSFSVSLWSSKNSSTIIAGDVLLLQNIRIVEFRNGLEGRASQISAVQVLLNSKDLMSPEGIGELITSCKVGDSTRSKLRKVAEWTLHTKCALRESYHELQVISKNWKAKEKESTYFLLISELLSQSKTCNVNVYACIGKIVLVTSPTSHFKGHLSVIDKHSLKEHHDIVRDFITAGCKLCGSPLHQTLHGESTFAIDCPNNPKYLHVLGQIYKPFMIYVCDQSGQVPLLVRNKAAEILFSNIIADDVSECYNSYQCMLLETYESGNSSTSGMIDDTGNKGMAKRRRIEQKPNFHLIWLIMIRCLLNQRNNSPFCFQISVNPEKNVEDGRFELVSLTMPIP